jgi:hypothetical protein
MRRVSASRSARIEAPQQRRRGRRYCSRFCRGRRRPATRVPPRMAAITSSSAGARAHASAPRRRRSAAARSRRRAGAAGPAWPASSPARCSATPIQQRAGEARGQLIGGRGQPRSVSARTAATPRKERRNSCGNRVQRGRKGRPTTCCSAPDNCLYKQITSLYANAPAEATSTPGRRHPRKKNPPRGRAGRVRIGRDFGPASARVRRRAAEPESLQSSRQVARSAGGGASGATRNRREPEQTRK